MGELGTIVRTTDGGTNWDGQTSGTSNTLTAVSFTDALTGTAVGSGGTIVRTSNGGASWDGQTSGTSAWLHGVCFTDANTGTAVGSDGTIVRTTNGGDTWTGQASGTSDALFAVYFTDTNTGVVVGENGTTLETNDGGDTWVRQTSTNGNTLYGVFMTDATTGTAVGSYGTILRTSDVLTAVLITGFSARPVDDGIALTWSLFTDERIDGFSIYRSGGGDSGERLLNDQPIGATTREYIDETALPGVRYRYTLVVSGAQSGDIRSAPVEAERPVSTTLLYQSHPNPFNPVTSIRYEIARASHVTLRVYSPSGQLVRTLVDRKLSPGSRETTWDGTNDAGTPVASGIYIYRLRAGTVTESRKMTLLK